MGKPAYELLKDKKFDPLIATLVDRFGVDGAAEVWVDAEQRLEGFLATTGGLSDLERLHAEGFMYPVCSIFLAIAARCSRDEALGMCAAFMRDRSREKGEQLEKLLRIPAMRRLFLKGFGAIGERLFGNKAGFEQELHESTGSRLRMDILACPYVRHCAAAGAPEVAQLFCANDEYVYGNLPGISFTRSGTIARGAERCDFSLVLD